MNPTDYVTYQQAKALKTAGFNWPCDHYYAKGDAPDGQTWILASDISEDFNAPQKCPFPQIQCSAPTLWQAQKWMREVKYICVTVYAQPYNGLPYYTGYILYEGDETEVLDKESHWFDDYEQALSETIDVALDLINPEKKQSN